MRNFHPRLTRQLLATTAFLLAFGIGLPAAPPSAPAASSFLRDLVFNGVFCSPASNQARRNYLGALLAGASAYAATQEQPPAETPPPIMEGLGDAHLTITTASTEVQVYFDQGLRMLHGFNHGEATRAFRHAQRLDPTCAMCFWGEAFALGPNINAPMDPAANNAAFRAARAAIERIAGVTSVERALIVAMGTRYAEVFSADRAARDLAFASAMEAAANEFPDNDLVQILSAEADMDTQPWDYWEANATTPKGRAGGAIARIERVLARNALNAGAIHLYIHLAEASNDPWRARRAARRLAGIAPNAGHLVHMPAHISYRIGNFRDAIRENIEAARVDEAYIARGGVSPLYQYGYYTHNLHFVVTSAQQGGDGRLALDYAARLDRALPHAMAAEIPIAQPVKAAPWFAQAQFGAPDAVLAAAAPAEGAPFVTGAWRYARAMALARASRLAEARTEAEELRRLSESDAFGALRAALIPAEEVLLVLRHVVLGKAFMAERRWADAIRELEAAATMQTAMPYMEPPYVYYPVRRTLAAAYLLSGQAGRSEQEFLRTLVESPNDAYAYWGLSQAMLWQGDIAGSRNAKAMFEAAFLGPVGSVNAGAM
jgi:hypothetical protein